MKTKTNKKSIAPVYDEDVFYSMHPDTIEDLIDSRPTMTDDESSWYVEHLWIYLRDGKVAYSICDEGGNHEPADQEEADNFTRNSCARWKEYNQWCAKHGEDPLGNFMVPEVKTTKENWVAILRVSILASKYGLVVMSIKKKGGKPIDLCKAPDHVAEFLELEEHGGRWFCGGLHSFADIQNGTVKLRRGWATDRIVEFEVEKKKPRSQRAIASEIRRKASQ